MGMDAHTDWVVSGPEDAQNKTEERPEQGAVADPDLNKAFD